MCTVLYSIYFTFYYLFPLKSIRQFVWKLYTFENFKFLTTIEEKIIFLLHFHSSLTQQYKAVYGIMCLRSSIFFFLYIELFRVYKKTHFMHSKRIVEVILFWIFFSLFTLTYAIRKNEFHSLKPNDMNGKRRKCIERIIYIDYFATFFKFIVNSLESLKSQNGIK